MMLLYTYVYMFIIIILLRIMLFYIALLNSLPSRITTDICLVLYLHLSSGTSNQRSRKTNTNFFQCKRQANQTEQNGDKLCKFLLVFYFLFRFLFLRKKSIGSCPFWFILYWIGRSLMPFYPLSSLSCFWGFFFIYLIFLGTN